MRAALGEHDAMLDIYPNFQSLRHSMSARTARHALYRLLVGRDGWPLTFRSPEPSEPMVPLSSNVYVHLPFCRSICPHCPYNKTLFDEAVASAYVNALEAEIRLCLSLRPSRVQSLYFGGGTPSLVPDVIAGIIDVLAPSLERNAEVGVEVHPLDATPELFAQLRASGVNRVSLGIESFDPDVLRLLGRHYSPDVAMRAIANAKAAGFDCVDANLIYGVPTQFPSVAPRDVEISIKLGVDQISAYPLFTFVHTGLGRRVAAGNFGIYGDRARIRTQKDISSICRENGLQRTSVWSFSRAEISPYTTVTHSEYRGFGAGAGSRLGNMLSFNTFSVRAFAAMSQFRPALVLRMNERLHRLHWLYWQIYRTHVDASEYARTFSSEVDRDFTFLLAVMHMLGWVTPVPEGWRVTESGAIWAHRIQCLFSLTYIDDLWTRCKLDPWPREVVLDGTR